MDRQLLISTGNIDIAGAAPPERLTGARALCCMEWDLKHVIGNLEAQKAVAAPASGGN